METEKCLHIFIYCMLLYLFLYLLVFMYLLVFVYLLVVIYWFVCLFIYLFVYIFVYKYRINIELPKYAKYWIEITSFVVLQYQKYVWGFGDFNIKNIKNWNSKYLDSRIGIFVKLSLPPKMFLEYIMKRSI